MAFKEVFTNEYFSVLFNEETRTMHERYLSGNAYMDEEELKQYALGLLELMGELGVRRHVTDQTQSEFVISPELQAWVVSTFVPVWIEMGLERMALVLSQEFITALANEQLMDDGVSFLGEKGAESNMETKVFSDTEEALAWVQAS